ncbi:hypothetical protein GU3_10545 [Oceanimonas sp. GK1]|nr:hypothetical protein GU3_10545 [Oceanimonas sp. GK1]
MFYTAYSIQHIAEQAGTVRTITLAMLVYNKAGEKNAHELSKLRQGTVDNAQANVDNEHACFCSWQHR